jgi:hypothetical protein
MEANLLKQDDYCKAKIVEFGWRYAKAYTGGHLAGQLVMHTILNRVRCGWGSHLQVIDSFSKYIAENEVPPLVHGSIWDPAFVKLLHAVEGIFDGSATDMSKGALYFGDLGHIERDWFREKIIQAKNEEGLPQHKRVADMGSFCFWS